LKLAKNLRFRTTRHVGVDIYNFLNSDAISSYNARSPAASRTACGRRRLTTRRPPPTGEQWLNPTTLVSPRRFPAFLLKSSRAAFRRHIRHARALS
jgi:hypothetical protein